MSKTIKVINLLNKIANGEEVPKKIKYEGDILEYDNEIFDYLGISKTGTGSFFNYLFVNKATNEFINNEVEIIEELEEIDIQNELETIIEFQDVTKYDRLSISLNREMINILIKAVKQLDKKMREK